MCPGPPKVHSYLCQYAAMEGSVFMIEICIREHHWQLQASLFVPMKISAACLLFRWRNGTVLHNMALFSIMVIANSDQVTLY